MSEVSSDHDLVPIGQSLNHVLMAWYLDTGTQWRLRMDSPDTGLTNLQNGTATTAEYEYPYSYEPAPDNHQVKFGSGILEGFTGMVLTMLLDLQSETTVRIHIASSRRESIREAC